MTIDNRIIGAGIFSVILLLASCAGTTDPHSNKGTLALAYKDYFPIGAAVNSSTIDSHAELITGEFSSITAENEMKPSLAYPRYNQPSFFASDEIADFARENSLIMRGHCFIWHQQTPGWFFASMGGIADRETLLGRVNDYMTLMVERYGDVVYAWDVVNEAVSDEGPEILRDSPYLEIIGEDYIAEAFRMARAADPEARLFYNDYNVLDPKKQDRIYSLLESLLAEGVPVDGIGFQGHWNVNYPDGNTLVKAIDRFAALGLEVQITELDISAYEWNDRGFSWGSGAPPEKLLEKQALRYAEIFEALRSRSDIVSGVTFWGVADDGTWLDDFPVSNRKNWPLLFNESHEPKPAYDAVMNFQ